jgi:hypothetical protein
VHEYDVALKRILTRPGSALLADLTGSGELRWLNVELPRVNNPRVDLLAELPGGDLVHFEFQSRNEGRFALRMAEYAFAIARRYGRFPRQIALYLGSRPLRMKNSLAAADLKFRFNLVNVRELDGEPLLASANLSDNVIAVLTKAGDRPDALRRILRRISEAPAAPRREAMAELWILAGLRGLRAELKREEKKMPITEDIMDNAIIGPMIRKGIAQGRVEGRVEGQLELLLSQIAARFGNVPLRIRKRLAAMKSGQLTRVGVRLLDAEKVDDLFAR